jgi:hypothetical protein
VSESDDTLTNALKRKIPGYGAYRDQQARRDDDRVARVFLAKRLDDCKSAVDAAGAKALGEGDLDAPLRTERIRRNLDLARSRVTAALEGYGAWFDSRQVDADLLDQITRLDENMVSIVDQIEFMVSQSDNLHQDHPKDLDEALKLLQQRIDRRNELLKNGA